MKEQTQNDALYKTAIRIELEVSGKHLMDPGSFWDEAVIIRGPETTINRLRPASDPEELDLADVFEFFERNLVTHLRFQIQVLFNQALLAATRFDDPAESRKAKKRSAAVSKKISARLTSARLGVRRGPKTADERENFSQERMTLLKLYATEYITIARSGEKFTRKRLAEARFRGLRKDDPAREMRRELKRHQFTLEDIVAMATRREDERD